MSESLQLDEIGQIAVNARDIERATAFYRDVLGVPVLFAVPGMAFFACGGVRLMLSLPSAPEYDHPSSILYFKVDDIRRTHEELVSRGVHFERAPFLVAPMPAHDLWMAFFKDSEGNTLALMSEVARGAASG